MGKAPTQSSDAALVVGRILARYWMPIVAAILFVIAQLPSLKIWWGIWMQDYSYYSHGPLIPFMVAYMVWGNKEKLASMPRRPSWIGYPLLVLSGALFLLARWTQGSTLQALVFVLMILSAILLMGGAQMTRLLLVPVLFLFTMIPIAPSLLDTATGKLQLHSAAVAAKFLDWTGYPAELEGSTIYSDGLPEPLIVGIPCSGLRTLISLITFTVFFIYLVRCQWWKKGALLVLSFPLSIVVNSMRITMIGYAGLWTGSAEAMHRFHDYSGYLGLVICFFILFGLAKLMRVDQFGFAQRERGQHALSSSSSRVFGGGFAGMAVIVVFLFASLSTMYASPIYPQTKGKLVRSNIPLRFGGWSGRDLPIDELVTSTLVKGDMLSRLYTNDSGYTRHMHVFIEAARAPEAFHDPHTCLPGGGTPISADRIVTFRIAKPRPLTIKASLLAATGDTGESLVLYWYMMGPHSMPRTGDVWQMNRANMIRDIRRLVLSPGSAGKLRAEVEQRQFMWYRISTDVIYDEDTDKRILIDFAREFVADVKGFGL